MADGIKMVTLMRRDLNMRAGKQVSQGQHGAVNAVLEILEGENEFNRNILKTWMMADYKKICLKVNSEEELLKLYTDAKYNHKIPAFLVKDNGLTEFHGERTITCCVIGPYFADEIDSITGHLQLM